MALREGSRGDDVTKLQEALKAAGFDPGPIDGIYGPKTAAAVSAYQKANDLTVDGIAGPDTLNSIGLEDTPTDGNATDYTDEDSTRFDNLPGKPEIWRNKDTGEIYVVYYPPGMDPPVPLRYLVNSEEVLKTYFGNKPVVYDHEYTNAEMAALGAVTFGDVGEIGDTTGDPWSGFTIKMERARDALPWLDDPQIFAIIASAYLENRIAQDIEFVGTKWWDGHNDRERAWLTKVAQDPASAEDVLADNRTKVIAHFQSLGVAPPSDAVLDYINQQWTQGTWSLTERNNQVAVITGGGEGIEVDEGLAEAMGDETLTTGTTHIDAVRGLWTRWLGPAYPPTEEQIAHWAGILRDDEMGGTARLTEMLRSQRLALFPEYEDSTLTWDDIAGPWKSMAYNSWGVQIDEDDPFLQELVRLNNANEAQKMLRGEGFDRGHDRVVNQMITGVKSGMASNVRGAV